MAGRLNAVSPVPLLPRPHLLARLSAPVAVLAAPHGYGKSRLIETYQAQLTLRGQQVVALTCSPDDRRPFHLANRLTRAVMRVTGRRMFEGLASTYAAGDLYSAFGLAQAVAEDLLYAEVPFTLLIDGVDGEEAATFVAELAVRVAPLVQVIVSGYEPLAAYFPAEVTVLGREELEFTSQEAAALGVPDNPYDGWPAPTLILAGGQGQPDQYTQQLVGRLAPEDLGLLPAALLDVWHRQTGSQVCKALGLPRNYLRRFEELGFPLRPHGDGVAPPALLREAMLEELRRTDADSFRKSSERLATLIEATQPIRALELRSEIGDEEGALALARTRLSIWSRERHWSQVRAHLEPYFNRLTADEQLLLARAQDGLATHQEEVGRALKVAQHARHQGAREPEASFVVGEMLLRLGWLDQAVSVLGEAVRASPEGSAPRLRALGWLALCLVAQGRSGAALMELQTASGAAVGLPAEEIGVFYVARASACLRLGDVRAARDAARQAHMVYSYNLPLALSDLTVTFELLHLLIDLGDLREARLLLGQLPRVTVPVGRWYGASRALLQAHLAHRELRLGDGEEEALGQARRALEEARLGGYHTLEVQAGLRVCLLHVHRHEYPAALSLVGQLEALLPRDPWVEPTLSDLKAVLRACLSEMPPPPSQRPVALRESALVRALVHGGREGHEQVYGAAVVTTWRNWFPWRGGRLCGRVPDSGADGLPADPLPGWTSLEISPGGYGLPPVEERPLEHHTLEVRLLGTPLARLDGRVLELPPRALALLAYLCDGEVHSAGELMEALFSDSRRPRVYLSVALRGLRSSWQGVLGQARDPVVRVDGGYRLAPGVRARCDLRELPGATLRGVLGLYRGPLALEQPWMFVTPDELRQGILARLKQEADPREAQDMLSRLRAVDSGFPAWSSDHT
ncbi:hypothetical protein E5F05_04545 (plasmid) [Deinococcus metallilatus]|uniref:Tetratricopeptide (TPR) repeat protein n=1 Tax=Deinococcus metallilatus TaxID=1211322 RepID=A0AAJ5JZJ3_9DEIO|nr:helix-turn-helix domain-containing protein [Deinococcus metallilatus]MBB5293786.1 tetratricopeptide (TPR) repeat protein [Deinococcus metallilatus]QBY07256.1 hypothetical protein E5F05_04545 [Deinococcus metallilatus]RXJ14728.1 hypothetical protein ERJ73_03275 [Deinococcus metallilatus]TLK30848.1 hypothetical protein FCS05_03590 [Deinococcus metallilatus]GMA17715.1 hypothetical protein GCM10025871_40460 [Deinococcus metallilatus]